MKQKTRQEHLSWCKQRALAYLEQGDWRNAINSMLSDLEKHPETASSVKPGFLISLPLYSTGSIVQVRKFIEGFN